MLIFTLAGFITCLYVSNAEDITCICVLWLMYSEMDRPLANVGYQSRWFVNISLHMSIKLNLLID